MLRRVVSSGIAVNDGKMKSFVFLECRHLVVDQRAVATHELVDCPHCGEEGKRGEEEKSEADGPRSV